MLTNVGTKINFYAKHFLFDERFKQININTYIYQHLFLSLIMSRYFQTKY